MIEIIAESVVEGVFPTYIEVDSDSEQMRYTVHYGDVCRAFPKDSGKEAVEEYLSNIRHQLSLVV